MKKIFVIFLVLFVGLLVGCASKPIINDNSVSEESDTTFIVKDINGISWKADKTIKWPGYTFESAFSPKDLTNLTAIPEFWNLPENILCKNPTKKPFIGRIVNNSDREYTFWIVYKITNTNKQVYKPDYLLEIKVPAHSIKYYIYDKIEMVTETSIGVYTKNKGSFMLGSFTMNDFDGSWNNTELATKILNEIKSYYFEETIFNNEEELDEYKYYYHLVKPFEYNEKDLISNWIMRY